MNFVKNLFASGLTMNLNDWITTQGVRNVSFTIEKVMVGVSLLTVPMYIWGKRTRSWTYRHVVAGKA